jgi:hypothetical protein
MVKWSVGEGEVPLMVPMGKIRPDLFADCVLDVRSDVRSDKREAAGAAGGDHAAAKELPAPANLQLQCDRTWATLHGFGGPSSAFDSTDRQQVASMSTHKMLADGDNIIDCRMLLRKDTYSAHNIKTPISFERVGVVDGQECFLVLHRAGNVTDRCDQLPATEGDSSKMQLFSYMEVTDHVRSVTPRTEVLLTFSSFRSCWLFLDRTCGARTLVLLDGPVALHRRSSQAWDGVHVDVEWKFSAQRLEFAVQVQTSFCKVMPDCVFEVAKFVTGQDQHAESLRDKISSWVHTLRTSNEGAVSRHEIKETLGTIAGNDDHPVDALVSSMVLSLAHLRWLSFLFDASSQAPDALRPFPPPAADHSKPTGVGGLAQICSIRDCGVGPEAIAVDVDASPATDAGDEDEWESDDSDSSSRRSFSPSSTRDAVSRVQRREQSVFCDLFRERKDVQVDHSRLPTLPVAIMFKRRVLAKCGNDPEQRVAQWVLDVLSAPLLLPTKFLFLYVLTHGIDTVGTESLSVAKQDTFIAVSLASCCPETTLRGVLNSIVNPLYKTDLQGIKMLLERRDDRYDGPPFICLQCSCLMALPQSLTAITVLHQGGMPQHSSIL